MSNQLLGTQSLLYPMLDILMCFSPEIRNKSEHKLRVHHEINPSHWIPILSLSSVILSLAYTSDHNKEQNAISHHLLGTRSLVHPTLCNIM